MATRKVNDFLWRDTTYKNLTRDGQLVFLHLLTHPHIDSIGCVWSTPESIRSNLGKDTRDCDDDFVNHAVAELVNSGLIEFNEEHSLFFVVNFTMHHSNPSAPNVIKSWLKCANSLPGCEETKRAVLSCVNWLKDNGSESLIRFAEKSGTMQDLERIVGN